MLLPGPLLVSFLAAWIISRRMDIPLTISRIRHRRRRDKEPGIRTEKFPKKKIPGSGWNPHSFPASKGRIQKCLKNKKAESSSCQGNVGSWNAVWNTDLVLRKWDFISEESSFRGRSVILKGCVKYRNGFWENGISLPRKAASDGNPCPAGNVGSWNVV